MHPALAPGMGKCRTCGEGQAHCLLRYLAALLCTCDPSRCNPSPAPSPPLPPSPLPPPPLPTPVGAKHVLFMVVDDMRPMMRRAYNFSLAVTPHMDQLASEGLTFTRAYCNYAICSPSRNSFMSGRRPDTTRVWEFKDSFRQGGGLGWTSLPEWYKRHGYLTLGSGKLFHVSSRHLWGAAPPPLDLGGVPLSSGCAGNATAIHHVQPKQRWDAEQRLAPELESRVAVLRQCRVRAAAAVCRARVPLPQQ
jgi:hypothetical protein